MNFDGGQQKPYAASAMCGTALPDYPYRCMPCSPRLPVAAAVCPRARRTGMTLSPRQKLAVAFPIIDAFAATAPARCRGAGRGQDNQRKAPPKRGKSRIGRPGAVKHPKSAAFYLSASPSTISRKAYTRGRGASSGLPDGSAGSSPAARTQAKSITYISDDRLDFS